MEKLNISKIEKNGEVRIACDFRYSNVINNIIRQIPGQQWSRSLKCWHLPYDKRAWKTLCELCKGCVSIEVIHNSYENKGVCPAPVFVKDAEPATHVKPTLNETRHQAYPMAIKLLHDYKTMLEIKKYSVRTIEIYLPFFKDYAIYFARQDKMPEDLGYTDIYEYIKIFTRNTGFTASKQLICAIKFYYEKILGRERMYFGKGSNHSIQPLPVRLDYAEIMEMAGRAIYNPGHRLCLWLFFHLGLNAADIIDLPRDIAPFLETNPWCRETQKQACNY